MLSTHGGGGGRDDELGGGSGGSLLLDGGGGGGSDVDELEVGGGSVVGLDMVYQRGARQRLPFVRVERNDSRTRIPA